MSEGNIREFQKALRAKVTLISDPADREVRILADADAFEISRRFCKAVGDVYREALRLSICPHRYLRNRESITIEDQLKLASSTVAIIGAGGLGGHVIHLLARMGVGRLVIVDCDVFDESNLNRQLFCTSDTVGRQKAEVAAQRVESINPGVEAVPCVIRIDRSNSADVLAGADVAVDALDNVRDRLSLERGAKALSIPLVHGALAGLDGQVMTIFPEDPGLLLVYGAGDGDAEDSARTEAVMGVPALMPSMVATLQAMEVVKVLLGRGSPLRNVLLHVGLEAAEMNRFPID